MRINVSTIVPYFKIICWLARLGINVMKRTVGYMAFRRAILAFVYVFAYRSFWYKVISIHQAINLVQIQIDSVEVYTTNISRHLFFLFTRNNYTSGNRNIFAVSLLKFVLKRPFSFTVNWSDYILALTSNVSRQLSFVSVLFCSHIAIPTTKTNSECSGLGL